VLSVFLFVIYLYYYDNDDDDDDDDDLISFFLEYSFSLAIVA